VSRKPMADVLGEVYEQFLGLSACGHAQPGKVIRLTAGHQAKVEVKPEGPVSTSAFDVPPAAPIISATEAEPYPTLTRTDLRPMSRGFTQNRAPQDAV
jgi:hypothetical protein